MHESSLAKQLLTAVLERSSQDSATRVRAVRGWIAETEQLDPEAIRFHFHAHARGTPAEGAELDLDLRWVAARCRACGAIFRPEHHVVLCPECGSPEGEVLGNTGVAIDSIEVD